MQKMLAANASTKSNFEPNCQKTWKKAMQKGGFVLRMVVLALCIGFWALTLNLELNNGNFNCLNPYMQETVGCWSGAKAVTANVTNRKKASSGLLKLSILTTISSTALQMQGRKRMGKGKRLERHRAIPQGVEAGSATVRNKCVAKRICQLIDRIRRKRGDLISPLTCPVLSVRNAQQARKRARVVGHRVNPLKQRSEERGEIANSPLTANSPLGDVERAERTRDTGVGEGNVDSTMARLEPTTKPTAKLKLRESVAWARDHAANESYPTSNANKDLRTGVVNEDALGQPATRGTTTQIGTRARARK